MMATTTVLDDDQAPDHAGQPIAPLTPEGFPYRYKLRGRGLSSCASTAEEVLALVIESGFCTPSASSPPWWPKQSSPASSAPTKKLSSSAQPNADQTGPRSPPTSAPAGTIRPC